MPQEKVKKIHLIYGCIASVLIVALGIALIVCCLDIYKSAPANPYSPEAIAQQFNKIALLVYVVIAVIIGGIALNLALPLAGQRPKALRDEEEALRRMRLRLLTQADVPEVAVLLAAKQEQTRRRIYQWTTAGLCGALMVYPVIYYCDLSHFPTVDLNTYVIRALLVAVIPSVVCLGLCYVCSLLCSKSISREIAVYKSAIAATKGSAKAAAPEGKKVNRLLIARCAIAAVAVCFIVVGIFNGGAYDVLTKACAICTECIGLG